MSYASMLRHRADLFRLTPGDSDGIPTHTWIMVARGVRCFLDLGLHPPGDPIWTPEAGRVADRTGVLFLPWSAVSTAQSDPSPRPGDRIKITLGPAGTFELQGTRDDVWRPTRSHHIEIGVQEVSGVVIT